MRIPAALAAGLPAILMIAPGVARAQDMTDAVVAPAPVAAALPAVLDMPLADPASPFDFDRELPAIALSLAAAEDVFDVQLAQAILGELAVLPQRKPPAGDAGGVNERLGSPLPGSPDIGEQLAALGQARLAGGPLAVDWQQRLDGAALAGKLGVSHADGPVEMHFDLKSNVPLAAPTASRFSYDTTAFVKVLPALKLGASASGALRPSAMRPGVEAMGPEAKLSLPGLGGSFEAQAGWRMPMRDRDAAEGRQPGELKWSLSFRKPL